VRALTNSVSHDLLFIAKNDNVLIMSELLVSTENPDLVVPYSRGVVDGSAPGDGLFTPEDFTKFSRPKLADLSGLSYPELYFAVHSSFVGDSIPEAVQKEMAKSIYGPENFPEAEDGDIAPLVKLGEKLYYKELGEKGPTESFKDFGLLPLGEELNYFLDQLQQKRVIVLASTGDTAPAAMKALQGKKNAAIVALTSADGGSEVQKGQMGQMSDGETVFNLSVEDGNFDDCQRIVRELNKQFSLGAANSINIARIASQVVYYFDAYFQAIEQSGEQIGDPVNFSVPSGNAGNILAGFFAKKMGLPINKLIVATTDKYDTLHRVVQEGVYEPGTYDKPTYASSMDISVPNNLRRIIHYLLQSEGTDPRQAADYLQKFSQPGRVSLDEIDLPMDAMKRAGFESDICSDGNILAEIKREFGSSGYLLDPHGATGMYAARSFIRKMEQEDSENAGIPTVVFGTAHPGKFPDTTKLATGKSVEMPDSLKRAREWGSSSGFEPVANDTAQVAEFILRNVSPDFRQSMVKPEAHQRVFRRHLARARNPVERL
jgi:threonine synthase